MSDERLTTSCACGWTITGLQDEVVAATIDHGQRIHNMTATAEQVLAQAIRTGSPSAPDEPGKTSRAS
jgi:predicted small metal-binding protein